MRRLQWMLLLALCIGSCSGCYNQAEIDQTMATVAQGWDIAPGGDAILATAQYALPPGPARDGQTSPKSLVRTGRGPTPAAAERDILLGLPRKPVWTLSNTILIGEKIARTDISLLFDHMMRRPEIREGSSVFLAYQCTPEEILMMTTPPEDTTGVALEKLIRGQQNQLLLYMPVTASEFLRKTSSPGVEPVLPQVTIEAVDGKKSLQIKGLAVFRGRQMVGSLNESESRGYRFLTSGSIRGSLYAVPAPPVDKTRTTGDHDGAKHTLKIFYSGIDVKPQVVNNQLGMQITITAEGNLYELASADYRLTTNSLAAIEESASQAITQDIENCVQKAQSYQSDILGWGEQIQHARPALWDQLSGDWPGEFSRLPFHVTVEFKVRRTYLVEDSVSPG